MAARLAANIAKYIALFCLGLFYCVASIAQDNNEAIVSPDALSFSALISAIKVDEKFYEVRLAYQPPLWTVASAVNIAPVDSELLTGSYDNGVLDLPCVLFNGNYYSALLVSAIPGNYSFSLLSTTTLDYCTIPTGIGPARGKWIRTADAPLSARNDAVIAWTGEEIVVVGGSEFYCPPFAQCTLPSTPPFSDGAAYDPLTDSWRKIADAPAGVLTHSTATIGSDIFVLALTNYTSGSIHLLRYRSAQDSWDEVALPENSYPGAITAYGADLVLYATSDTNKAAADWQLDTSTGQWTQIPEDPLGPAFNRQLIGFGEDLYLFDHALVQSPGGADGPSYLRAARLRGQQWELLPVADSIGSAPNLIAGQQLVAPVLGCGNGGAVNGFGRCIPYGAVFDTATDTWHALPTPAGYSVKYIQPAGGLSDDDLVLYKAGLPALDAVTNEWFTVPLLDVNPNTARSMRGAGPYGFAFGGVGSTGELLKDSWIWKP